MHGLLDTAANIVEKPITTVLNDVGSTIGISSLGDDVVKPLINGTHDAITGSSGGVGADLQTSSSSATAQMSQDMTGPTTFAGSGGGTDQQRGITNFGGESVEAVAQAAVDHVQVSSEDIESLKKFFLRPRKVNSISANISTSFSNYFSAEPIREKLSQFAGVRFTLCVRVISNFSPMESGYLLYTIRPVTHNQSWTQQAAGTREDVLNSWISNAPHQLHNFNEQDSSELKLPYAFPYRFLDTTRLTTAPFEEQYYLGDFQFSSSASNPVCAYYVWLEDLQLFYPSNQSRLIRAPTRSFPLPTSEGPEHHSHISESRVVAQNDRIDDVAHAPGIAKPMAVTSVTNKLFSAHTDSFYDLFRTPTIFANISVSTGSPYELKYPVTPLAPQLVGGSVGGPTYMPTKLSIAPTLFKFWRGSISYRFHAIKTKFHNGRLQFGFVPHVNIEAIPADFATDEDLWSNIHSEVWNLRDSSVFEFSCPYRLSEYYAHREGVSGTLLVRSIGSISAPDNVDPDITILSYIFAGPDFQVARYLPFINSVYGGVVTYQYQAGVSTPGLPQSEGPFSNTKEEKFPVFLNDSDISISQAAAIPCSPGFAVSGFDIVTSDFDIASSELYCPNYRFAYNSAVPSETFSHNGNDMNWPCYISSLFIGSLCDPYVRAKSPGQFYQPYGTNSTDFVFPYTCNLSYLPKQITQAINVNPNTTAQINNRNIETAVLSSLQNAQFCFPFEPPPLIAVLTF